MTEIKNDFLSSLVFLSRIPVKINFEYNSGPKNLKYFPMVGIIIGTIAMVVAYLSNIFFGSNIAAVLTVLTFVVLTGGLHLDGLSDSFDGLYSYRDKEKIIEIMKDSRIGAMGLLAVLFNTLLKIAFISILIEATNYYLILLIPFAGRISILAACYKGRPMVKSKMGEPFIGRMKLMEYILVLFGYILTIGMTLTFKNQLMDLIPISIGLLIVIGFAFLFRESVYRKIDGISGDILGCICEISEMLFIPGYLLGVIVCKLFI